MWKKMGNISFTSTEKCSTIGDRKEFRSCLPCLQLKAFGILRLRWRICRKGLSIPTSSKKWRMLPCSRILPEAWTSRSLPASYDQSATQCVVPMTPPRLKVRKSESLKKFQTKQGKIDDQIWSNWLNWDKSKCRRGWQKFKRLWLFWFKVGPQAMRPHRKEPMSSSCRRLPPGSVIQSLSAKVKIHRLKSVWEFLEHVHFLSHMFASFDNFEGHWERWPQSQCAPQRSTRFHAAPHGSTRQLHSLVKSCEGPKVRERFLEEVSQHLPEAPSNWENWSDYVGWFGWFFLLKKVVWCVCSYAHYAPCFSKLLLLGFLHLITCTTDATSKTQSSMTNC